MKIGIFDSGIGGLCMLRECVKIMPQHDYIYLTDSAYMPYGDKSRERIRRRTIRCVQLLTDYGAQAVVAACNTATAAGISEARKVFGIPLVGLEPALKPAYNALKKGKVLVLATQGTLLSPRFKQLLTNFEAEKFIVMPMGELALDIEKNILNLEALRPQIYAKLNGLENIDCVVLGCSHYVFVKKSISDFFEGSVTIFDGIEGAAKRLKALIEPMEKAPLAYNGALVAKNDSDTGKSAVSETARIHIEFYRTFD